MRSLRVLFAASGLMLSAACATKVGSRSLPEVRGSYNEAVSASTDEQMLLNVVRLRYLHSTTFLQVASVTTQYSLSTNVGVNGTANIDRPNSSIVPGGNAGGSAGLVMTERPTITYIPLQGEAFVRRLVTPLSGEQVMLMLESGWGADLVVNICIRQINDIYAPASSDDTRGSLRRVAELMRTLKQRHELLIGRGGPEGRNVVLSINPRKGGAYSAEASEFLRLLRIPSRTPGYEVTSMTYEREPNEVAIQGRSVLDAMFYLAGGVDVPDGDDAAYPYPTLDEGGPRLHVRQSKRAPEHAYVKVRYRDRWFYVDEADHESKRAFAFLTFMFNLTSVSTGIGPVLTVGAG